MRGFTLLSALAASIALVLAAPTQSDASQNASLEERAVTTLTTLTASQIASYAPYTQLARAAYCAPSKIKGWNCGEACSAVPGIIITLNGGDGNGIQYYYVGQWPAKKTIVVGHQGTDPTQFLSVLTDANFFLTNLNSKLFPGVPSGAQIHNGFGDAHADTGATILAEVKRLLLATGYTSVTTVGHSLGGALAELDALMFRQNLPSTVSVKSVTYGTPRVGNPTYAHFFDSVVTDFTRVNNDDDMIPIVPGRGLGFLHPQGEVHMLRAGYAVACPGNDDASDIECQIQSVPTIFQGNILNHLGPYEGIWIGTLFCT